MARDYCNITWGKALDVAGVPADSVPRRPESIFYDSNIRELPGSESPPPEQPAKVSEVPITHQVPLALGKFQRILTQMLAKEKKLKLPRARTRARTRVRARPQTPLSLSPNKLLIQGLQRQKFRAIVFVIYLFSLFNVSVLFFFFFLRNCTTLLLLIKICSFCFIKCDK